MIDFFSFLLFLLYALIVAVAVLICCVPSSDSFWSESGVNVSPLALLPSLFIPLLIFFDPLGIAYSIRVIYGKPELIRNWLGTLVYIFSMFGLCLLIDLLIKSRTKKEVVVHA